MRGGITRKMRKQQENNYKLNYICSDLADFAYAGTYAELTPSLRDTRKRNGEQKMRRRRRKRR